MKNAKWHVLFWFLYFWIVYTIDLFLDPNYTTVVKELIFFLFQNLFLFYGTLFVFQNFSARSQKSLIFSILKLLVLFTTFIFIRYFIRYKFMAFFFDKRYADAPFGTWFASCFTWILNGSVYALGYTYAQSSIRKQKELLKSQEEKAKVEQEKLILENARLRAQINPHFLFNTLGYFHNRILDLDPELAEGVVALSDIMRSAIREPDQQGMVLLEEEVGSIENLVGIYQMRYSNGVYINLDIQVQHAGLKILPHILITLVENAMKHGALHDPQHPLTITMWSGADDLCFKVHNKKQTGPKERSHGIGIRYIRSQLDYTYKDHYSLEIVDEKEHYTVTLIIDCVSMQAINPSLIKIHEQTQMLYHR